VLANNATEGIYGKGIKALNCSECLLANNNVTGNLNPPTLPVYFFGGIELSFCASCEVYNNYAQNNSAGIMIFFDATSTSPQWPNVPWTELMYNNATENGVGIYIDYSNYVFISDNNASHSYYGVWLNGSSTNKLAFDNASACYGEGIWLSSSYLNDIELSSMSGDLTGLQLNDSNSNLIIKCNITSNSDGVEMDNDSTGNTFYHVNFVNNAYPVSIEPPSLHNYWDDGPGGLPDNGGNYWSGFNGGSSSGGIWDSPYVIDPRNIDHYPLVNLADPPIAALPNQGPYCPISAGPVVGLAPLKIGSGAATDPFWWLNYHPSERALNYPYVIGQGYGCNVNVTLYDLSGYRDAANVTVRANAILIGGAGIPDIAPTNCEPLSFALNTSTLGKGIFTITVTVDAAQTPGNESETATLSMGTVTVTIPGDIDGDGYVFLSDLGLMAAAWTSTPSSPNWNPNADIVDEGQVFLGSLGVMAQHWTESWTP
jgi:parallel beta-helix repeat protein